MMACLEFLRAGDTLVVHAMDRLARNLDDLRQLVRDLATRGVAVAFVHGHPTFSGDDSSMATLLLSLMDAFAQFERALIRERPREGIPLAKAQGKYQGGRPPKRTPDQLTALRADLAAGLPKAGVARRYGVSRPPCDHQRSDPAR